MNKFTKYLTLAALSFAYFNAGIACPSVVVSSCSDITSANCSGIYQTSDKQCKANNVDCVYTLCQNGQSSGGGYYYCEASTTGATCTVN